MNEKIKTPAQLIPRQTGILGKPEWLTPAPPRLFFFSDVSAVTIDSVEWRDKAGLQWIVPPGFQTDGASYPWPLGWFWDKWALNMRLSATLHDMRYALHDYCSDWPDSRQAADYDFLAGMRLAGADWQVIKYIGVRLGGNVLYEHQSAEAMMESWLHAVAEDRLESWILAIIGEKRNDQYKWNSRPCKDCGGRRVQ